MRPRAGSRAAGQQEARDEAGGEYPQAMHLQSSPLSRIQRGTTGPGVSAFPFGPSSSDRSSAYEESSGAPERGSPVRRDTRYSLYWLLRAKSGSSATAAPLSAATAAGAAIWSA